MSSSQGIRAGRAFIELGVNDSMLSKGLLAAQQRLRSFGRGLSIAGGAMAAGGAAIVTPLVAAAFSAAHTGDELAKMSDRTGASVESLSELKHAAEQSDVEFASLGKSMQKMQRNMVEAGDGNKTAAEGFERLGLSVDKLRGLSPDQQFEAIAQKISEIEDPALRTAAAMDVFGKSGADLMPLMLGGAGGIAALRKEARDLGLQVSTKDAQAAVLFGDTWANFQKVTKDVITELGMALLPVLTDITSAVIPIVVSIASWISANRKLVITAAGIGAALMAAGTVIGGIGVTATVAATAIGGLLSVGGVMASVFAAIVSPVGLVVIGLGAAAAAFLTLTDQGQAAVDWFTSGFRSMLEIIQDTIGGVVNAIQGGDIALAGQIAFLGLKLAVFEVMQSVAALFGSSIDSMMEMLAGLWKRINIVANRLNAVRQDAVNFISGALQALMGDSAEDKRGAALEAQRRALMASKGIETTANDNSTAAALESIQQQDSQTAQQGVEDAINMDSAAIGQAWADAMDPDKLRQELAALTATAHENAARAALPDTIKSKRFDDSLAAMDEIADAKKGTSEAADRQQQPTLGTFSAFEAALVGGGSLQQKQLTAMEKIERNTRRRNEVPRATP